MSTYKAKSKWYSLEPTLYLSILKALPATKWKKEELLMLSNLTSPNLIWSEYLVSDWYQLVWQWSLECPILALVWLFHQCPCLLNQTSKLAFLSMSFQCHQLMQMCSKKIKKIHQMSCPSTALLKCFGLVKIYCARPELIFILCLSSPNVLFQTKGDFHLLNSVFVPAQNVLDKHYMQFNFWSGPKYVE